MGHDDRAIGGHVTSFRLRFQALQVTLALSLRLLTFPCKVTVHGLSYQLKS